MGPDLVRTLFTGYPGKRSNKVRTHNGAGYGSSTSTSSITRGWSGAPPP
jgi:hypothetical protein